MRQTEQERRAEDEGTMTVAAWGFGVVMALIITLAVWGCDTMVAVQWPSL